MKVVVVGAGHAGGQLSNALRMNGWDGSIILIGAESWYPYQRPPLSKQLLTGEAEPEDAVLYSSGFYEDANIGLRTNARVERIDRKEQRVELADGTSETYDYLALTTGASVRRLNGPGSELENIVYVRDMDDALTLRGQLQSARRIVIVGGGYIGLEVAAAAAKSGAEVTVVEGADRLMNRVVAPVVSDWFRRLHEARGVRILAGTSVHGFRGEERVSEVLTDEGALPCDLAVVGIGIAPDTALAEACGLDVDDGIVVDEYTRTSDPHILAAGDCTRHPNEIYGRHVRLESVQNASEQATAAARTICGDPAPYQAVPWFWSHQYDAKLQIAGLSWGHDRVVVRGDPAAEDGFAAYYLRNDVLVAVDAVNSPRDYMMARRLIARQAKPDPEKVADPTVPVKELG